MSIRNRRSATSWSAAAALLAATLSCRIFAGEIHDAARDGDASRVQALLAATPSLAFDSDKDGWTALHWAAFDGRMEATKLLLTGNAAVNAKDKNGETPLHYAAFNGHEDVAAALLARGAEVNAMDNKGETPLHVATSAVKENRGTVELLLANNADVKARDANGYTPLQPAAGRGDKEVVELLLAKGADVSAMDNKGMTALMVAASNGHKDVVQLLLANRAEVDARNRNGLTALYMARTNGHEDVAEVLLANHAGPVEISQPVIIERPDPSFSQAAMSAKRTGSVALSAVVDMDGKVRDVQVVKSLGFGLDEKAVAAVETWKFKPGEMNGKPVSVKVRIEVDFKLVVDPVNNGWVVAGYDSKRVALKVKRGWTIAEFQRAAERVRIAFSREGMTGSDIEMRTGDAVLKFESGRLVSVYLFHRDATQKVPNGDLLKNLPLPN